MLSRETLDAVLCWCRVPSMNLHVHGPVDEVSVHAQCHAFDMAHRAVLRILRSCSAVVSKVALPMPTSACPSSVIAQFAHIPLFVKDVLCRYASPTASVVGRGNPQAQHISPERRRVLLVHHATTFTSHQSLTLVPPPSITVCGSMPLPSDLLILRPSSSTRNLCHDENNMKKTTTLQLYPCVSTVLYGACV